MDRIIGQIWGAFQSKSKIDSDFIDRLNDRYTINILTIFTIIVSTKQYVGEPINCWMPAHFTANHERYSNSYCWIQNTYYLPFRENIPNEYDKKCMIAYYQWVPMILLVQAVFFYAPYLLWKTYNGRSGINVNKLIELGKSVQNSDEDRGLISMTKHMDR